MKKEDKYIALKTLINGFIIVFGTILMICFIGKEQHRAILNKQKELSDKALIQIEETIELNRSYANDLIDMYHEFNRNTIKDVAEILELEQLNGASSEMQSKKLEEINITISSRYIFVISENGDVVAAPYLEDVGNNIVEEGLISKENLESIVNESWEQCLLENNDDGEVVCFYSIRFGENYLLAGYDYDFITYQVNSFASTNAAIENVSVGNKGFAFSILPQEEKIGLFIDGDTYLYRTDYAEAGLSEAAQKAFENGEAYEGNEVISGVEYHIYTKAIDDATIIGTAVVEEELYAQGDRVLFWTATGFAVACLICLLYTFFIKNDVVYTNSDIKKKYVGTLFNHKLYFNQTIGKKVIVVAIACLMSVFAVAYYSQTLFGLSDAILDSKKIIADLETQINKAEYNSETVESYYNYQFLDKARLLSSIIENDPSALNEGKKKTYCYYENGETIHLQDDEGNVLQSVALSNRLIGLCVDNNIEDIYLFDEKGRVIATSSEKWNFIISYESTDQSYPFREIVNGNEDHYVQDVLIDDSGDKSQYIGVSYNYFTTNDENGDTIYVSKQDYESYLSGNWNGNPIHKHSSVLQIKMSMFIMNALLQTTDYDYLIDTVSEANNAVIKLFANDADHTVLYSSIDEQKEMKASEIGFSDSMFVEEYNGYQYVNGTKYFINVTYYKGYYIATSTALSDLYAYRLNVSLYSVGLAILFLGVITSVLLLSTENEAEMYRQVSRRLQNFARKNTMFNILLPSGRESSTKKAEARWDNRGISWVEKTPEQKLETVTMLACGIVILYILYLLNGGEERLGENSIILYILSGQWERGCNIFAFTAVGMVCIAGLVVVTALSIPVRIVTSIFGTKTETIGHLCISVIKYGGTLVCIFYCLYLVGFDTQSLLASAGILSLVIGLGSQSLIKDIVAGIFIIFEGEFRVGDIIDVGGYRGQVLDIGLRTTKIIADDHNIKIIKNDSITGVINMTRVTSLLNLDIQMDYGVPIDEVERVMKEALPKMKDEIPEIIDGPVYKGVSTFNNKTITISIEVGCKEHDIPQIKSQMNKTIIDLLYENKITKR